MHSLNSLNVSGLMGTFRRSRSPGALPLIPALMDIFRTDKLKAKTNACTRSNTLVDGLRSGGLGGGILDPIMAMRGDSSRKGYFFRP